MERSVNTLPDNLKLPREVLQFAWETYPERTALISPQMTLTYNQLRDTVLHLLRQFADMGLRAGDVCYCQLRGEVDGMLALLAASRSGVILVGIPANAGAQILSFVCQNVPPAGCLFEADGTADATLLTQLVPTIVCRRFDQIMSQVAVPGVNPPLAPQSPDDRGLIGFSSGTTGVPKILQASYGVYVTGVDFMLRHALMAPRAGDPLVMLVCIPVFGAGSGMLLPTWFRGGSLVMPQACTAEEVLRLVPLHRVTHLFITPSVLIDLLDAPGLASTDLSSLRCITYGTELMPAAKLEEALRHFGPILQQGYGSAEVLPPVTVLQPEEHMRDGVIAPRSVLSSVGRPIPEVQVIIANDADQALPRNAIGHVLIKSPTQFKGYLNRPEVNAQVQRGGWLHIGDIGYLDNDGLLHVLGRAPDLIHRHGCTTYPRYAEEAMHDHPAVKETAYVQVGEQAIMAVSLRQSWRARLHDPALADDMLQFLTTRVEPQGLPDAVRLLPELPRSPLGKVLRREVRLQLEAEMTATSA